MTTQEKVIKYLQVCKYPKTQAEIARGAKVNPNTLRRVLARNDSPSFVMGDAVFVFGVERPLRYKLSGRYSVA